MRRAARVDDNQPSIVKALRKMGATVELLHQVGSGCPDLLVGFRQRTILIELKDGDKAPSDRRLTPDQLKWHSEWRGGPLAVVCDVDGAIRALKSLEQS
jgi:hypothetical protein